MLSEKIIEERLYVEKISQEVKDVRAQMKKDNLITLSVRWSSAAAILLFSFFSIYLVQLNTRSIIEEKCYTNYTRSSQSENEKDPPRLEVALQQINSENYEEAVKTLNGLPESDHKDWFLLNANLGLEDFDQVDQLMGKIQNDEEHLYFDQIDNYLLYDIYLLKIKRKIFN
ncbi:hypothetical protein [Flammeovirga aprica]|uniref:Tetratricopeptide repeat protein n=1 Tax=Flammeovirga aprica JL-4 TaxID=694437 RepID=A0A7X9S1L0_9BACT|nr:hypothetical protein [Flammeovirga aprica]NME72722.1 hypothetical protein [Flammeovirga aprica JL-4]